MSGAGRVPGTTRAWRFPVIALVVMVVAIGIALGFARGDARAEAVAVEGGITGAILLIALNVTLRGNAQRLFRTVVAALVAIGAGILAVALPAPATPGLAEIAKAGYLGVWTVPPSLVMGTIGLAVVLFGVRQWFPDLTSHAARSAVGTAAFLVLLLGLTTALVIGAPSDPLPYRGMLAWLVVGGDIALITSSLGGRQESAGREFGWRAFAALSALAAFVGAAEVFILYQSPAGSVPPGGAPNWSLGADWHALGQGVVAAVIALAVGALAATWAESLTFKRIGQVAALLAVNAGFAATLPYQTSSAVLPLVAGLIAVDAGFLARGLGSWRGGEAEASTTLHLVGTVLLVLAADLFVLWATNYLPDAGVSAAKKLLWIGDGCAVVSVVTNWLPGRLGYFLRRCVLGAITVFIITFVVFYLVTLLPDQWWAPLVHAKNLTPEQSAAKAHLLGVDRPIFIQFLSWLDTILQWPPNLGFSYHLHQDVASAIFGVGNGPWFESRLWASLILLGASYILQLVVAIPVGIISATKPGSRLDNFVTTASFVGISLPNYWFGSLLIFFLAIEPYTSHGSVIFPAGGEFTDPNNPNVLDLLWHLFLPTIVLAVQGIAAYARFVRGAMLDVLSQDFIRTARAKGLSPGRVIIRHGFRNSLLPLITLMGIDLPQIFVGAIVTEFVFNWPGMGQFSVNEVQNADVLPVIAIVLILGVLVVLGSLIADLCYTLADPRIKYDNA